MTTTTSTSEWLVREEDWAVFADKPGQPLYLYMSKQENPARSFINLHRNEMFDLYEPRIKDLGVGFLLITHDIEDETAKGVIRTCLVPSKVCDSMLEEMIIEGIKERLQIALKTALAYFEWPSSVPVLAATDQDIYCFLEDFSPTLDRLRRFAK